MTIGQRIREQRRKAELTQEQLAELLSVSPQAVSRWETDAAMPDISLLLPLCNLFGVSADYLLGMETYEKDLRRAEFDEAFKDYWKHDDKEKNYEIACRAAAEYPGDMPYLEWLASAEFYLAFLRGDDAEYRALLELLALPDASPGPAGMAGLKKNISAVEADRERYRRSFQKFRRTAVYRFYQKFRRVAGNVCRRLGG